MRLQFLILLFLFSSLSYAQESGIGIRFGEPISFTYKDFWKDFISIEMMIGRAGTNNSSYYQKNFDSNPPSQNALYLGERTNPGISINLRSAIHRDVTDQFDIETGYLLGYVGLGAQIRAIQVTYLYSINFITPGGGFLSDTSINLDLGPEFFVGSEYYFNNLPISVFAEAGIFLEILDRGGHTKGQGGIGIRYLF